MPYRTINLTSGEYYHIYNRGVEKRDIFTEDRDYQRFIDILEYYRFTKSFIRFSTYNRLLIDAKQVARQRMESSGDFLVSILGFVLMPNHFHILVKQVHENGISLYMKNLLDSYTKYFNIKHKRVGPLFQGRFKAVYIENDEHLLHLSRYIHLNPYTSSIVETYDELFHYPWSSLPLYVSDMKYYLDTNLIYSQFKTKEKFKEFICDQADYQRNLHKVERMGME